MELLVKGNPADSQHVSAAELQFIQTSRAGAAVPAAQSALPLKHYLRSPMIIAIAAAFFAANYILYFFLSWMPSYLTDVRHLDIKTMSILTVIPGLSASSGACWAAGSRTEFCSVAAMRSLPARW